jgi:O-antigen biosynthesis protein
MTVESIKVPATISLIPDLSSEPKDGAATSNSVWLRVEPVGLLVRHRWVRLRYSSSFFDDPVRPLIRFETAARETHIQAMNGPVLGSAEWIGRVPDNTVAIAISPCRRPGPFDFRLDDVAPVSRLSLLCQGMIRDPKWVYWTVRSRLVNSRREAWQALKFASRSTAIKDYAAWHERFARPLEHDGLDRPRADWSRTPPLRFLLRLDETDPERLRATVASLQAQIYTRWSLHVAIGERTPAAALAAYRDLARADARLEEIATWPDCTSLAEKLDPDDRIGILDAGDRLPNHALAVIAEELARDPDRAIIYSDEDEFGPDGAPQGLILKPDWSPVLQQSTGYVGRLAVVRASDLKPFGPEGLTLLVVDECAALDRIFRSVAPTAIGHLRRILYHRGSRIDGGAARTRASPRTREPVAPKSTADPPEWPMVGVVVATRDRADLLAECVRGLVDKTDYPRREIVIVDNGSTAPDALALLRDLRADTRFKILERPGPFNFSALSNDGARATNAPVLLFLNNDIVMLNSDWLKPLVRWAVMPQIGVVGAKLLFPNRQIQHAGVVLGFGGIAGHVYRRMPANHPGYCNQLATTHEMAAVTGACIAVERKKFEAVGGFDAENLPIDLNDIDFCLRISAHGWTNLWTPDSVLVHRQSASRGIDPDPFALYRRERTYFVRRWAEEIRDDPYFHPALSLYAHDVALP